MKNDKNAGIFFVWIDTDTTSYPGSFLLLNALDVKDPGYEVDTDL